MTTILKNIKSAVLAASLAGLGIAGTANAEAANTRTKLLSAHFAPRNVVQVEVGDFHFKPGQVALLHTHDAPAVGYVAKGGIIYQVEGEKPQVLREGDAFYEPTGKRILRFDNVSPPRRQFFWISISSKKASRSSSSRKNPSRPSAGAPCRPSSWPAKSLTKSISTPANWHAAARFS